MNQVCESPRIILHPNLIYNAERASYKVIDNVPYSMHEREDSVIYNGDFFSWFYANYPHPKNITLDTIDNYCFVDDNGEILPIYLEVPCGSCDVCRMKKINSVVQQCEFEMLDSHSDCANFFVTLTYRQLPWCTSFLGGLCIRHVQAYIKRLRSWIIKNVGVDYSRNMKVIYSGEYGSVTQRPHYHIAFFHFPFYAISSKLKIPFYQTIKIFEYLWSKPKFGFMENFVSFKDYKVKGNGSLCPEAQVHYDIFNYGFVKVKRIFSNNVGKYIGKYISKGGKFDKECHPFFRKSINLGMSFFNSEIREQVLTNKCNKFTYKNLSNKIKENSHLCSYYLRKLYPSVTRIVSSECRKALYFLRLLQRKLRYPIHIKPLPYSLSFDDMKYVKSLFWIGKQQYKALYKQCLSALSFFGIPISKINEYVENLEKYNTERVLFFSKSGNEISVPDEIFRLKKQYLEINLSVKPL